ncbi:MAG TPA: nicotinate-nucleotide adenylyltransferase [Usitatibacteraceae bacterium]|nr:nicotinate-nucleotide adenylyltransferase [Usitatibacteraceae bacterium]
MASPLGLFGGTFDPVHFGHLRLAAEMREAFRLERVVFLPTGHPWQRARDTIAGGAERVRMLELATAGEPAFTVDDREVRREGPTYSVETLAEYRNECGPDTPLLFLCGTDAFARVETWHLWQSLFELAHFAVAVRADDPEWQSRGPGAIPRALWPRVTMSLKDVLSTPAGRIMTFSMTPLAISSTAIRGLVQGRSSIRYLTPDPVVDFIQQHQLYGTQGLPAKLG